uniref:Immediate early response 2 n=1 Tax=Latimeria chalumnae TaxID=7897 RepID=H3B238_LATCH
MEVKAEAQKIMTLAVMKLYNSRLQKGGMKLHRNLLLSLVMRNAKEMYLSAKLEAGRAFPSEQEERMVTEPDTPAMETIGSISEDNNNADTETQPTDCHNTEDPEVTKTVVTEMETDCNSCDKPTGNRQSRKRSSPAGKKGSEPESVPSKKARLEEEPQQEQGDQKNAYHHNVSSLVKVMEASFSGFLGHVTCSDPPSCDQKSTCRHGERMLTKMSTLVRAVGVC